MGKVVAKPRVNLNEIYARVPAGSACYYLPKRMAIAASVACVQLWWETRREANEIDKDQLDADISALLAGLGDPNPDQCQDCPECPELPFDIDDPESIENWIVETDKMAINISQTCCCGCCCQQSQQPDLQPPPGYIPPHDDDSTVPPDGGTSEYLSAKCDWVHYFLYAYRLSVLQWTDNLASYSVFEEWWNGIYHPVGDVYETVTYGAYLNLLAFSSGYSSPIDQFVSTYDPLYNQMVCILYNAPSAMVAKDNWLTFLSENVFMGYDVAIRTPLLQIASYLPFTAVWEDPIGNAVPDTHVNRDCSHCAIDDAVPDAPTGYKWVWATPQEEITANSGTTSIKTGGGSVHYTAQLEGDGFTWNPTYRFNAYTPAAGETIEGQGWKILANEASGGNDPGGHLCRIGGKVQPAGYQWMKLDDGNDPNDFNADWDDVNFTNYSPGSLDYTDVGFYRRAGVGASGGPVESAAVAVFWLVKVT
jgi:hypothetical protein